jgi:hypothetical protein
MSRGFWRLGDGIAFGVFQRGMGLTSYAEPLPKPRYGAMNL